LKNLVPIRKFSLSAKFA